VGYVFFGGACHLFNYPNAKATRPVAISRSGTIVGDYIDLQGKQNGFYYNGTWNTVNCPTSSGTTVNGIGGIKDDVLVGECASSGGNVGYYLLAGNYYFVKVPNSIRTGVTKITRDGSNILVGYFVTPDQSAHGFWVDRGTYHGFDFPGALNTYVTDIVDGSYTMVGFYQDTSNKWHSYYVSNGNFTGYDAPFSDTSNTLTEGADDQGRVAGQVSRPDGAIEAFARGDGIGWPASNTGVLPTDLIGVWDWERPSSDGGQCFNGAPTGYFWSTTLQFAGNGTVALQLRIFHRTYPGGSSCCEDDSTWNFSGTYATYGHDLHLNVQGTQNSQFSCNPAANFQTPRGPYTYDWYYIMGVAPDGSLLYVNPANSLSGPPFDQILLRKTG
jgi:hypothetical protein